MRHLAIISLIVTILCVAVTTAVAQDPMAPKTPNDPGGDKWFKKKDRPPEKSRSLDGAVLDPAGDLVEGAVVQLKDTKSLRVRSYVTLKDGKYRFHGLSTEIDYEVKATHQGRASRTRRLTVYDSRKKASMDLKLKKKEEKKSKT